MLYKHILSLSEISRIPSAKVSSSCLLFSFVSGTAIHECSSALKIGWSVIDDEKWLLLGASAYNMMSGHSEGHSDCISAKKLLENLEGTETQYWKLFLDPLSSNDEVETFSAFCEYEDKCYFYKWKLEEIIVFLSLLFQTVSNIIVM